MDGEAKQATEIETASEDTEKTDTTLALVKDALDKSEAGDDSADVGKDKPKAEDKQKDDEADKTDAEAPDDSGEEDTGEEEEADEDEDSDKEEASDEDKDKGGDEDSVSEKPSDDDSVLDALGKIDIERFKQEGVLTKGEWGTLLASVQRLAAGLKASREILSGLKDEADARRSKEFEGEVDNAFDGLGDEFVDLFGKGRASSIDKTLLERRNKVLKEADALIQGYRSQGRNVTLSEAIHKAALLQLGEQGGARQTGSRRREAFSAKPSAGEGEKGDAAALHRIEMALRREK